MTTTAAETFAQQFAGSSVRAFVDMHKKATQPLLEALTSTNAAWEQFRAQSAQLSATAQLLTEAINAAREEARPHLEALRKRQKELAARNAGLSSRIGYALKEAEKRGPATLSVVVMAFSGDEKGREELKELAKRGRPLAAYVLALISELTALSEEVLALTYDTAAALASLLTAAPSYESPRRELPRVLLAGSKEQNAP